MFAIDLLEGKAKPVKIDFKRLMLKTVPFLIPVMAMAAWAASYQQDCAAIDNYQALTEKNQAVIDGSGPAVQQYRRMNSRLNEVRQSLETINKGLDYRLQVTDLLIELVQHLPDNIFIYELDMNRTAVMEKLPKDKDTNKKAKEKRVVRRTLWLQVCGFDPVQSDRQVSAYVEHLKTSPLLTTMFSEVKSAARRQGMVDQQSVTFYEIECTLRDQESGS